MLSVMYDSISSDYDLFVNWPGRLAVEIPFIKSRLLDLSMPAETPPRILDAACGTGMHAIALARQGFVTAGADLSLPMIERAKINAQNAGVNSTFRQAGFGGLAPSFSREIGGGGFDALICLGNSLPHLLTRPSLDAALVDMASCLRPGGLVIIQNRNFDVLITTRERWMEPQSSRSPESEWVFVRFYDFEADGLINFHMLTLTRNPDSGWSQKIDSSLLYPWLREELIDALNKSGFDKILSYGSLAGDAFDPQKSANLVLTGRRLSP